MESSHGIQVPPPLPAPGHPGRAEAFLRTLRVLYVEDHAETRDELALFLSRKAGEVEVAADGRQGLALFTERPFDLVVTDIQMPGLDGLAMVEGIRALDPGVPVIVTTAFEQPEYLHRAIRARVDQYVLKPLSPRELQSALVQCAGRLLDAHLARRERDLERESRRLWHEAAQAILFQGLAHDFNNLHQAALMGIDLALVQLEGHSPARASLEATLKALEPARELGRKLMVLARPGEPKVKVDRLEPLVREAVRAELEGSGIHLECRFPAGALPMEIDAGRLGLAFAILARNAREAMPGGGIFAMEGRVEAQFADPVLSILIRDTGPGIPPEIAPMVFEPYFTTQKRGSRKGMGLGLALGRAILRAHGGSLDLAEVAGPGAAFRMTLPLAEAGAP